MTGGTLLGSTAQIRDLDAVAEALTTLTLDRDEMRASANGVNAYLRGVATGRIVELERAVNQRTIPRILGDPDCGHDPSWHSAGSAASPCFRDATPAERRVAVTARKVAEDALAAFIAGWSHTERTLGRANPYDFDLAPSGLTLPPEFESSREGLVFRQLRDLREP